MFSQEQINNYVSVDIVLTCVAFALAAVYFIYKWIDYRIFVHRIKKEKEGKK